MTGPSVTTIFGLDTRCNQLIEQRLTTRDRWLTLTLVPIPIARDCECR